MAKQITNIKALSFDLDDTLYDNEPVIRNAFQKLYDYLVECYPNISQHYHFDTFLDAAITLKEEHPLIFDLGILRRLHIEKVMQRSGYQTGDLEQAFDIFWQARQQVELFPGVHKILAELSARLPMVAISNGNACIKTIGIERYFQWAINTSDTGKPKPDSSMFLLACEKLAIQPEQLLHIGDNLEKDINGAFKAGCPSIWFNHRQLRVTNHKADGVIENLSELLTPDFF